MASEIPSHIYAAVFLMAADFDLNAEFGQIIDRVEAFEASTGRLFGSADTDLRTSAFSLLFQAGCLSSIGLDKAEEHLMAMRLRDLLTLALGYDSVYCNDEGEYWEKIEDGPSTEGVEDTENSKCINGRLKSLMSRSPAPTADEVRGVLSELGLDQPGLTHWLEEHWL
ncbi:MAG: hypothetical protein ACM3WU_02700 [Bacillota bacterium]